MKVLYYDCFSGISGDMHLGAMIDLGVDPGHLLEQLKLLKLKGYEVQFNRDRRKGISGMRVDVLLKESAGKEKKDRNLADISSIIKESKLDERVKERSLKMFKKLAGAEARIHGLKVEEVHFHEVGAVDSIVDIVGAAICLEFLKPDRILASEVELGGGFVQCAHGTFPVPAPATAEILSGIPVRTGAVRYETTTPTGALILACNVDEFGPLRGLKISRTAYGIGQKDLEIPNVLRVFLAEAENSGNLKYREKAWMLECNIDDMNPEMYGYVMDTLFDLGADDVFITPIIMKKARPASKLSVLCKGAIMEQVKEALLTHTTSLGVRAFELEKTMLEREISRLRTRYGEVNIKTAIYKGQKLKSKPEYEDCVRLAREQGIPVHQVYREISGLLNKE